MDFILYRSESDFSQNDRAVGHILEHSVGFNEAADITGYLFCGDQHFLQFIEGPALALEACYERIQRSRLHWNVEMLASGAFEVRQFSNWNMGLAQLDDLRVMPELSGAIGAGCDPTRLPALAIAAALQRHSALATPVLARA